VDTKGRIIRSYGGAVGSRGGRLNTPTYLAVDSHGHILVTDTENNRIQVFNSKLFHLSDVEIPGHTLKQPMALHLDAQAGRLYIAEVAGGRIFVLDANGHDNLT